MNALERLIAALDPSHLVDIEDERDLSEHVQDHIPAAVLIAIRQGSDPAVILTQRPNWLRNHAGQIAFPGGKIDAADTDAVAAALREAEEEIGLSPVDITIVGNSDTYYTGSGFRIEPVIAIVKPDAKLTLNPEEVEEAFEVPLDFLLDPRNGKKAIGLWQGQERHYYEIEWNGRRIWGVTAGIIANLWKRMA
jgi:8-oxo-dGTP pyrophosphatase MutT (NUDIX family)